MAHRLLNTLTKKHVVGIVLLITAVICILNAAVFGHVLPTSSSFEQLVRQSISASTGYTCILYGLSPWLFNSHFAVPRRHIRYVLISMLIFLILANIIALSTVIKTQYMVAGEESVNILDLYTPFELKCRMITLVSFVLTIVLLTVALVLVMLIALAINNLPDFTQEPSKVSLP
ncbi:PREDICTED: uncharacterized protein LOC108610268 [Drosophila arizonae]|uniref:Uncharacterized protein LOC108610268 n=1 Tax=Drosophila arizonae TaxID=7263 RepID=A0ABM1NS20_DROAR|nr:PREDICTED: uncharacterized protein LOC108610268 [Drosophila arizonae]